MYIYVYIVDNRIFVKFVTRFVTHWTQTRPLVPRYLDNREVYDLDFATDIPWLCGKFMIGSQSHSRLAQTYRSPWALHADSGGL